MTPRRSLLVVLIAILLSSPAVFAQYGGAAMAALNGDDAGIVKGQPCIWVQTITTTTPRPDGTKAVVIEIRRKWRDSEGRFRREIAKVTDGQEPVFEVATILDPVANTVTTLHMDTKIARIVHMPAGNLHPYVEADDKPMLAMPGVQVKVEHMDGKQIMGVHVEGRRVTRTRPPGTIGNDKTIVSVSERWIAPDLKILMSSTMDDPRQQQHSEATQLARVEPEASMFQVPADYAAKEAQGGPLHMEIVSGHL